MKPQHIFEFVSSVSVVTDKSREDAQKIAELFLECLERHIGKHVDPDSYFCREEGFDVEMFGLSDSLLEKRLNEARAEGMGEALEIAKSEHRYSDAGVRWDDVDHAVAQRQAALREVAS